MTRVASLALAVVLGCSSDEGSEAGVGGDRTGCAEPGTHSVLLAEHSCACEPGYTWCSPEDIDDFDCCADGDGDSDSDTGDPPDAACGSGELEQIACLDDPELPGPGTEIWACNGESWVPVPGLAEFECQADGYQFGYGCIGGIGLSAEVVCGYGQGTDCDEDDPWTCHDEAIIDGCVWGRRTLDYCRRLCDDLEVWGPGFIAGECVEMDGTAICVCS